MQEIFVNIFHKFDFERQKMAEEKQGGKIITPLGWENNSQNLKVDLTQRSNKKAELGAKSRVLSWAEFQQSDEFKAIKRQKMPNGKWQFVPNNEQLRKLVFYEEISLGEIDTSEITDMSFLFSFDERKMSCLVSSERFNWRKDFSGIAGWDTSRVTTFEGMFYMADNFNEDINKCDTSSVTNMNGMFMNATHFNQNLSAWGDKLDKVKDMSSMFKDAKSLTYDFFSWWETSEVCDLKDRIKDSGVEKLRDVRKKINEIGCITKEQRVELAQIDKELKIIKKPALSNFDIYKVIINEEDFLKSILPYEGEGEKVVKNWLVKDVAYRVYLLRYDKENDEFIQDKSEWDFAFCKVFESWFMIKKGKDSEKLPSQLNEALLLFRIYQGRDMRELE